MQPFSKKVHTSFYAHLPTSTLSQYRTRLAFVANLRMFLLQQLYIELYLSLGFNQKNNKAFTIEFNKTIVIDQVLYISNWCMGTLSYNVTVVISGGTKNIKLLIITRIEDFANFSSLINSFFLLNDLSNDAWFSIIGGFCIIYSRRSSTRFSHCKKYFNISSYG